jgi:hypothetical protein
MEIGEDYSREQRTEMVLFLVRKKAHQRDGRERGEKGKRGKRKGRDGVRERDAAKINLMF